MEMSRFISSAPGGITTRSRSAARRTTDPTSEADARERGAGQSYLVQHSAGSGKSNTIAWLAHRLSSLHAGDEKVFDKVVVTIDNMYPSYASKTFVRYANRGSFPVTIDAEIIDSLTYHFNQQRAHAPENRDHPGNEQSAGKNWLRF